MGVQTEEDIPFVDRATLDALDRDTLHRLAEEAGKLYERLESHPEDELEKVGWINWDQDYIHWWDKGLRHNSDVGKTGKIRLRFYDVPYLADRLKEEGLDPTTIGGFAELLEAAQGDV